MESGSLSVPSMANWFVCRRPTAKNLWRRILSKTLAVCRERGASLIIRSSPATAYLHARRQRGDGRRPQQANGGSLWKCLLDPPEKGSYAAPTILVERQYQFSGQCVAVLNDSLIGVQIGDGKLLWRQEAKGLGWITSMTPLVADGFLILPGGRSAPDLVVFSSRIRGSKSKSSAARRYGWTISWMPA